MGLGGSKSAEIYSNGIEELLKQPIPSGNNEFWEAFWSSPSTTEEIFTFLTPENIRNIKENAPHNLGVFIVKIVSEMRKVVSKGPENKSTDYRNALNCVRLIMRILPFLMEDQSDGLLEGIFWRNEIPPWNETDKDDIVPIDEEKGKETEESKEIKKESEEKEEKTQKEDKIDEGEKKGEEEKKEKEEEEKEEEEGDENIVFEGEDTADPLAIRLLNAVVNLLFYPQFTVASSKPPEEPISSLPLNHVWAAGVGVKTVLPSTTLMDTHRCEILKCLLVLFSEAFYHTPEETGHYVNKWLDIVACNHSFHSKAIFYSLVNVACSYDPVGWGVPYNHLMFGDYKEGLADTALQVLVILLNHTPSPLIARRSPDGTPDAEAENIFVGYLKEIEDEQDFALIYAAFERLLNNPLQANNTYLPNSSKEIGCHQELLMLLWKLIQENSEFLNWLLIKGDVTKVVDPVLHMLYQGRKDTTQSGLIHLGTFILLFLSGSRGFGVQLNRPFTRKLTIDLPPFTGNYADYLTLVFIKMLLDGHKLDSLYECLLTIMANISPYIKSLAMITNIKLMHLFKVFSRPKYLFSSERAHRYVFFLLEIFNNSIQYQYSGNYRLIYAMIRNKELFTSLANLSLEPPKKPEEATTEKEITKEGEEVVVEESSTGEDTVATGAGVGDGSDAAAINPEEEEKEEKEEEEDKEKEDKEESALPSKEERVIPPPISKPVSVTPTSHQVLLSTTKFKPTNEWLLSWKNQLPLSTSLRLLNAIVPQIPSLVSGSSADEKQILDYLTKTTMVGLLPVPHPILIRRYQHNAATESWLNTYMWGVVYLRNELPPLFFNTDIKLFIIKVLE